MSATTPGPNNAAISPEFVGHVVREVLARLRASDKSGSGAEHGMSVSERVISVAVIERAANGAKKQLLIPREAVITPAAADEAKRCRISIVRCSSVATAKAPDEKSDSESGSKRADLGNAKIFDREQPERAAAVRNQLQRRGIRPATSAQVVLSDTPAIETHRQSASGKRAVMIRQVADVPRFAAEFEPNVWVLDMADLNFIAAVNAAQQILQLGGGTR